MSNRGRPSIVDDKLRRARFLKAIALGLHLAEACRCARVSPSAVRNILNRRANSRARGAEKFRRFRRDYRSARIEPLLRAAASVNTAIAKGDGKLALKFLQVRWSKQWATPPRAVVPILADAVNIPVGEHQERPAGLQWDARMRGEILAGLEKLRAELCGEIDKDDSTATRPAGVQGDTQAR